jgi:hypothetical protein
MSEAYGRAEACGAIPHDSAKPGPLGAAEWLCLAAAPAFAIMALLTAVLGGGQMAMLCGAAPEGLPLTGMVPMYLLMSAVHTAPWVRLIAGRRSDVRTLEKTAP